MEEKAGQLGGRNFDEMKCYDEQLERKGEIEEWENKR
jgi:hypothetical protein